MQYKYLKLVDRGDVLTVYFGAASLVDENTIQQIGKEFSQVALEASGERKLLLNFRGIKFMSSAMLGKIVRLHKQCKKDRIQLKLCAINPAVFEVFTITRLNKLLAIHDDEESALSAFNKRGILG